MTFEMLSFPTFPSDNQHQLLLIHIFTYHLFLFPTYAKGNNNLETIVTLDKTISVQMQPVCRVRVNEIGNFS